MPAKPIPDGYHTVTPYLIVRNGAKAIDFYKRAFGARELFRLDAPGGKIGHAELMIGNSPIMMGDEQPEMGAVGPETLGGSGFGLCLYVEDVDARFLQAIAAGGEVVRPVSDMFYGDRAGTLLDPFGHKWTIATHKEDLTPAQIGQRLGEMMKAKG